MHGYETEAIGLEDEWAQQQDWPVHDADVPAEPDERSESAAARKRRSPLASLVVRRSLGIAVALGMAYGVFHVVFRTDILAPALAYVGPAKDGIDWVLADPARAWMALAALAIPHIGAYYFFFEDRR